MNEPKQRIEIDFKNASEATRLLEKRRQLDITQDNFIAQREENLRQKVRQKQREESINLKDHEFQSSLVKFNRFLKENEIKKNRAEKKLIEQKKQNQKISKDISKLEKLQEELEEKLLKLKKESVENVQYTSYLESVKEAQPTSFNEIEDILTRYEVINETHEEVTTKQQKYLNDITKLQKQLEKDEETNEKLILNLSTKITQAGRIIKKEEEGNLDVSKDEILLKQSFIKDMETFGEVIEGVKDGLLYCKTKFGTFLQHGADTEDICTRSPTKSTIKNTTQNCVHDLCSLEKYIIDLKTSISTLSN